MTERLRVSLISVFILSCLFLLTGDFVFAKQKAAVKPAPNYLEQAKKELRLKTAPKVEESQKSNSVGVGGPSSSPATIKLAEPEVILKAPERFFTFYVGTRWLELQGQQSIVGMNPYDVATVGPQQLVMFQGNLSMFQYVMPGRFFLLAGPSISFGFGRKPVRLLSPTGVNLGETGITSLLAQAGGEVSVVPAFAPNWSLGFRILANHYSFAHTSEYPGANASYVNKTLEYSFLLARELEILPARFYLGYGDSSPLSEVSAITSQSEVFELGVSVDL